MALTGLKIQKLLPKTNCKECGSNTCLAFAMKLAARKADLSLCPYASDEAKKILGAASEPPVRKIELGKEGDLLLGEDTVLYRHEKTFVHQTAIAVNVNNDDPPEQVDRILESIRDYQLERVGKILTIDMVSITQRKHRGDIPGTDHSGTDPSDIEFSGISHKDPFVSLVERAHAVTGKPLVIRSHDVRSLQEAAKAVSGTRSVLVLDPVQGSCQDPQRQAPGPGEFDRLRETAIEHDHVLALNAESLDELVQLSGTMKESSFHKYVLIFTTHGLAEQFHSNSIARTAALKDNFRVLGFPYLRFLESGDILEDTVIASTEITKYGGIIVFPSFEPAQLSTLLTLRLNIYTDPQRPIQVEPDIYPIGEPGPDSPVFVTTNFSLTYFIVSGEIENSGISAWLVVPECEGMSVLTAWAAGKFTASTIAKFVKESGFEEKVKTREMVIPGYVAQISGELEENLPGWKIIVGPQEAADIESFVSTLK